MEEGTDLIAAVPRPACSPPLWPRMPHTLFPSGADLLDPTRLFTKVVRVWHHHHPPCGDRTSRRLIKHSSPRAKLPTRSLSVPKLRRNPFITSIEGVLWSPHQTN